MGEPGAPNTITIYTALGVLFAMSGSHPAVNDAGVVV